jgi:hypothetical protein
MTDQEMITKVVQYGTVGCLAFEDFVKVAANGVGVEADIPGLIEAQRCFDMPIGTSVEVVQRIKPPGGLPEPNLVCVKPTGLNNSICLWTLIQRLEVKAAN